MAKKHHISTVSAGTFVLSLAAVGLFFPAYGQVRVVKPDVPKQAPQPIRVSQPGEPGTGGDAQSQYSAVRLVENSEYRQYINIAETCFKDKAWNDAVTALQLILDNKEDYYVRIKEFTPNGRPVTRWASVKYEANRLLGSMPREGLDVYEVRFGAEARNLLNKAKKTGDLEKLADVAQRFFHTKAGPEANDLLATYFLDRGEFFSAALRFERLLALTPKQAKISDLTLFKAALAYKRIGDIDKMKEVWKRLSPSIERNGGLKIKDKLVSASLLKSYLDRAPRPKLTASPHDWTLIRGNYSNSAQASGSPPFLNEVIWKRPTIRDKYDLTNEYPPYGAEAKGWIKKAVEKINGSGFSGTPVMPGFFPIAVNGKMIYRTYSGITAVSLKKYTDEGFDINPGDIEWKSTEFDGGLAVSLSNPLLRNDLENWLNSYHNQAAFISLVYENSLVGSLSSDVKHVYAVDDLAVPVPPNIIQGIRINNRTTMSQAVRTRVFQNSLQAFELDTGKIKWRLGLGDPRKADQELLEESHFLGPPLSVGGKLYVLNEQRNGRLRLLAIDPEKGRVIKPAQTLGTVDESSRFAFDPNRRIHAVHLAYGEGILVCPTNAGTVLGIDLLSRTLAWAYPYREKANQDNPINNIFQPGIRIQQPTTIPLTQATWKVAPPVISKGKLIFTAPDAHSLHCINLRDGTLSWKHRKSESDLFLAGVWENNVIIVGKNRCFARDLQTGMTRWSVTTGDLPSGQGVTSKGIYYLPLQNGEVCAIDVTDGTIWHNRPSKSGKAPGNLVFYKGSVLTQTPDQVIAYPQLTSKLDVVQKEYEKDPTNLEKLTYLGELRLANGEVRRAINHLRLVMAKEPPDSLRPRVRQKLYEAMTDLFQSDYRFAKKNYFQEYKALLTVPDDNDAEARRRAKFLRLQGRGEEASGNLVAAFHAYRDFGALPLFQKEGVPALDDPNRKIPTQVWLRARISTMFAKATPLERGPLEQEISKEWDRVKTKKNINTIRSFVAMFDVPFEVGQEARLHLAENIIDRNDEDAFLEAELSLEQLRTGDLRDDPDAGGKALEVLARLEIRKSKSTSMKLAADYYRQLAEQFPNREIRNGKTGLDLYNELATDKRFLPYLEKSGPLWAKAKIRARETGIKVPGNLQGFVFQPEGDLSPATEHLRIILDPQGNRNSPKLRLVNTLTNKTWEQPLGYVSTNYQFFQFLYRQASSNPQYYPNARFRFYKVKGHLGVVQVGTMVYCLDLENPRILWQHSLVESNPVPGQPNITPQSIIPDADGNLVMLIYNRFNGQRQTVRIGQIGSVEASYVCLLKQNSLVVLDPLRGKILWSRKHIPNETRIFGDDRYIYLVDVNGGAASGGRALRASDGTPVEIKDFSHHYQNRIRILGNRILSASLVNGKKVLRLYDIQTGRDVWSEEFADRSEVLKTEDPNLTGFLEPDGTLVVVDLKKKKQIFRTNVLQGRVSKDDIAKLEDPLLLRDKDHFYVALNNPIDNTKVRGGRVFNNFSNGTRCVAVNGWFCAFHRKAGKAVIDNQEMQWKAGDLSWHSCKPMENQMIVLEEFHKLPLVLFTSRYNRMTNGRGTQWVSFTQAIEKKHGLMIYGPDSDSVGISNGSPRFTAFSVDVKDGTINLMGVSGTLQFYVDDGRVRKAQVNPQVRQPVNDVPKPRIARPIPGGRIPVVQPVPVQRIRKR